MLAVGKEGILQEIKRKTPPTPRKELVTLVAPGLVSAAEEGHFWLLRISVCLTNGCTGPQVLAALALHLGAKTTCRNQMAAPIPETVYCVYWQGTRWGNPHRLLGT